MTKELKTTRRLRIFAGPNGSGKTTIIKNIPKKIPLGIYVNADDIERALHHKSQLSFSYFKINITTKEIKNFFANDSIAAKKLQIPNLSVCFTINKNNLIINNISINSYIAADIAEFIRQKLIKLGLSFSFETVFSHSSKLEIIKKAKQNGYKIYLYYVATESSEININRVKIRVAKDGHNVDSDVIRKRYIRSLELLFETVKMTDRAYLFDNSGKQYHLVSEVTNGKKVAMLNIYDQPPEWFIKYFYLKSL